MPRRVPSFPVPTPAPGPHSRTSQVLVGVLCVGLAALLACSVLVARATSSWMWWVAIAVVAALWWALRRRTRSVAERSARALDERDLATRNGAAWWGLAAALLAGCLSALALLITARVQTLDSRTVLDRSGATLLALMIAAVPTMVLAATDSNHDDDEPHR